MQASAASTKHSPRYRSAYHCARLICKQSFTGRHPATRMPSIFATRSALGSPIHGCISPTWGIPPVCTARRLLYKSLRLTLPRAWKRSSPESIAQLSCQRTVCTHRAVNTAVPVFVGKRLRITRFSRASAVAQHFPFGFAAVCTPHGVVEGFRGGKLRSFLSSVGYVAPAVATG